MDWVLGLGGYVLGAVVAGVCFWLGFKLGHTAGFSDAMGVMATIRRGEGWPPMTIPMPPAPPPPKPPAGWRSKL